MKVSGIRIYILSCYELGSRFTKWLYARILQSPFALFMESKNGILVKRKCSQELKVCASAHKGVFPKFTLLFTENKEPPLRSDF